MFQSIGTEHDWKYTTEPQPDACLNRKKGRCPWPRGKVLGGSSVLNAMLYQTGNQLDYEQWYKLTEDKSWNWLNVKKYLDNHLKFAQNDIYEDNLPELEFIRNSIIAAGKELGYDEVTENRENGTIGYQRSRGVIKNGMRANAARTFLVPIAFRRNLHVLKNAQVGKVLINKKTKEAEGVEVWVHNKWVGVKASKEVILSAGAVNSPQVLMLSGIGPEDHLKSLNIEVIENLPVGENLLDHTISSVFIALNNLPKEPMDPRRYLDFLYQYMMYKTGPFTAIGATTVLGFINTTDKASHSPDMQFHHIFFDYKNTNLVKEFLNLAGYNEETAKLFSSFVDQSPVMAHFPTLLKPKSKGTIMLKSSDPFEFPIIDPHYNEHSDDVEVLSRGVQHVLDLIKTKTYQTLGAELLRFPMPECDKHEYLSKEYLVCYVKVTTTSIYHPTGTCQMGTSPENSVVNSKLQVWGVKKLRVVDASVMPDIPAGNINIPVIMVGLRAADIIKDSYESSKHEEL